nr:TOBE domain-containing protein [Paracoccus suum]
MGLRPETLKISATQPHSPAVRGKVLLSEMSGAEVILHCDTDLGSLTMTGPRKALPSNLDEVWVGIDIAEALYFDASSGMRVPSPEVRVSA